MTFTQALVSLARRDTRGDMWLSKPFTASEIKRCLTKRSDYGAHYWTTEPKGAFGALKCLCGVLTKRKYPWFPLKSCPHPTEAA